MEEKTLEKMSAVVRKFCSASRKLKFQFSSKEEADNFMEVFASEIANSGAMDGDVPIRSYFCKSCGCWHITHLQDKSEMWRVAKLDEIDATLLENVKRFKVNGIRRQEVLSDILTIANQIKGYRKLVLELTEQKDLDIYSAQLKELENGFWSSLVKTFENFSKEVQRYKLDVISALKSSDILGLYGIRTVQILVKYSELIPEEYLQSLKKISEKFIKIRQDIRSDIVYILNELPKDELREVMGILGQTCKKLGNSKRAVQYKDTLRLAGSLLNK